MAGPPERCGAEHPRRPQYTLLRVVEHERVVHGADAAADVGWSVAGEGAPRQGGEGEGDDAGGVDDD